MDIATAYVTFSGTQLLFDETSIRNRSTSTKRFLVGIDWFRSEPSALDALNALAKSRVRVVDGEYLVNTENCQPRRTYHPKAYLLKCAPPALIIGSANLSANGLRKSIELSVLTKDARLVAEFESWFQPQWRAATPWSDIRNEYVAGYGTSKSREFVVTEDDDVPGLDVYRIRWVTQDRLRLMRAAQHLWVDVGHLHNRGPLPGTDLQFSQMTRVFFGYPPRIVPGNTPLLDVPLSMDDAQSEVRPMVFNRSSSMDRLSLPVPGEAGWPEEYDEETLLFSKADDGSFVVRMATGRDRTNWMRQSLANGFTLPMSNSSREWGVF